jgi:electron transport complex protein RnfE
MQLTLIPNHPGFLLALLPPGAFIGLGLLIAARNWFDSKFIERRGREHPVSGNPLDTVAAE